MATATFDKVLTEAVWNAEGAALWTKRAVLVLAGILLLAISAKIKLPIPPSPVPVNLQTFVVLAVGAAYGPRLGLTTILGYLLVGMIGFDVFTSSTAEFSGWGYMQGSTGGYLVGFLVAALALGYAARKGWDRNVVLMAAAMVIGNLVIYTFGLAWLAYWISSTGKLDVATYGSLSAQTAAWGLFPFLIGDLMKVLLAAILLPTLWKLVGKART